MTYISVDLTVFQEEPFQGIIREFGYDKPSLFMAVCMAVIKKGHYAAMLTFEDKETLGHHLGISRKVMTQEIEELVKSGHFNNYLYASEGVITCEFIQKEFFRASQKARKEHMTIPLHMLCLRTEWRRKYRLALHVENSKEVIQCMSDKEYDAACRYYGGEDNMHEIITSGGVLFQEADDQFVFS